MRGTSIASIDRRTFLRWSGASALALPLALTGCGADAPPGAVRVAYQQFGQDDLTGAWLDRAAEAFAKAQPGRTIHKVPIVAAENDYFTKNELMMSSPRTSPDLAYEDTFILLSDVAAGYIQPIDDYVKGWSRWEQIVPNSRDAVRGEDGKVYAVPTHTDTRGIWYDKRVMSKAGLPDDWKPRDWQELLDAARAIKDKAPDVECPIMFFSGKAQGEKASMQGFQMLLFGTDSRLYDEDTKKWMLGTRGFVDALTFIQTIFAENLTLGIGKASDPNVNESIYGEMMPAGQVGFLMDGSWISQNWIEGASSAWPEWSETLGVTRMPTQNGQGKGWVTLAGGWSWVLPQHSREPDAAFELITQLLTKKQALERAIEDQHITIFTDVAEDPEYKSYSPTTEFFTSLVAEADYRPTLAPYPQVSSAIQQAMEDVMTQSKTPQDAAASYDERVISIVGEQNTARETS